MKNFFLLSLAKAINACLALDPESTYRLQKLTGKTITIFLKPFDFSFQCSFSEKGVRLFADENLAAQAKIIGTPVQMLGVMLSKEDRQQFFAEDVLMEGDAEVGQDVIDLFDSLQIDWEEHLSHLVGDVSAYHVGRFVKRVNHWLQEVDMSLSQSIREYIQEEKAFVPPREAFKDFFQDIDNLRMDVDRVEARIKQLHAHLTQDKEKQ